MQFIKGSAPLCEMMLPGCVPGELFWSFYWKKPIGAVEEGWVEIKQKAESLCGVKVVLLKNWHIL